MYLHANAELGLAGRLALVQSIERGCSIRAAAASFSVSPATAHRWWQRWRAASDLEQASLACLLDRSSRPARSPRRLAPELERAICDCRRKTGWGTAAGRRRDGTLVKLTPTAFASEQIRDMHVQGWEAVLANLERSVFS